MPVCSKPRPSTKHRMKTTLGGIVFGLVLLGPAGPSAQQPVGTALVSDVVLRATDHPPLPEDPSKFWMIPTKATATRTPALNTFTAAVKLEVDNQFARALPIFSQPL